MHASIADSGLSRNNHLRTKYVQHCAFRVSDGGHAYRHKRSHEGTGKGSVVPQPVPVQLYSPPYNLPVETTGEMPKQSITHHSSCMVLRPHAQCPSWLWLGSIMGLVQGLELVVLRFFRVRGFQKGR